VGVCGSDFHAYGGTHPAYTYPRILGHELAGEILQAPAGSERHQAGKLVCHRALLGMAAIANACLKGRTNCCENLRVFGIHIDGGLQGALSVPVHLLHKSTLLDLDQLALVETLGIGRACSATERFEEGGISVGYWRRADWSGSHAVRPGGWIRCRGGGGKNKWRREFAAGFVGVETLPDAEARHGRCSIRCHRELSSDECEP